jgi:HK97 family phage prohead protease
MKLEFSAPITAANIAEKTITGIVVPFGKPGATSMGPVVFELGSVNEIDPASVKLLLEHDNRRPIGRATNFTVTPGGINGTFKIAETTAGADALIEASEGLRDGLSIGAMIDEYDIRDGIIHVTSARMIETSLVTSPAFDSARVTQVAASEPEDDETTETIEEIETMSEQPIEEVEVASDVEASKVEASSFGSPIFTQPRALPELTAGQYAHKMIQAQRGSRDAREFLTAAGEATTTDNEGLIPVPFLREVIGVVDSSRPFIDSITRAALPAAGMSFRIPRWVTLPSVAETAELAAPSDTMTEIDDLEVDVVKFAGSQRVSIELLERSDPSYLNELLRGLAAKYAQSTDAYAFAESAGGAGVSTAGTLYEAIADGIADSGNVMRFDPNRFLADPGNFGEILGATDLSGRPLFAAINPQNAAGAVTGSRGNVAGLDLYVDYNIDTGTGVKGLVYPSAAATFYESGTAQVRVNVIDTMTVEIAVYGFVALANKYPTAFRNITVA